MRSTARLIRVCERSGTNPAGSSTSADHAAARLQALALGVRGITVQAGHMGKGDSVMAAGLLSGRNVAE